MINGEAISSSDLRGQVALQSRHEVRPLLKRLHFGKPRHEINVDASFRNADGSKNRKSSQVKCG
jgi:hypothetical protein